MCELCYNIYPCPVCGHGYEDEEEDRDFEGDDADEYHDMMNDEK